VAIERRHATGLLVVPRAATVQTPVYRHLARNPEAAGHECRCNEERDSEAKPCGHWEGLLMAGSCRWSHSARAAPRRAWHGLAAAPDGRPWRPATKAQWRVDGRTVSFRTQIRPCTPPDRHHSGVCAPCAGIGDTAWRQAPWARQSRVVDAGAHCGPNAGRAARTGKSAPGSWAWAVGCRKLQWPSRRSAMRSAIAYRFFATDSL
jgi:hypothetical protein